MQSDDITHDAPPRATHDDRISPLSASDEVVALVRPRRLRTPFGCFP